MQIQIYLIQVFNIPFLKVVKRKQTYFQLTHRFKEEYVQGVEKGACGPGDTEELPTKNIFVNYYYLFICSGENCRILVKYN